MWQLIEKLGYSADDAFFFTSLPFEQKAFKADLKSKVESNDELAEQLPPEIVQKAIGLDSDEQAEDLASFIDEGTDNMGVMLYFGDTSLQD